MFRLGEHPVETSLWVVTQLKHRYEFYEHACDLL